MSAAPSPESQAPLLSRPWALDQVAFQTGWVSVSPQPCGQPAPTPICAEVTDSSGCGAPEGVISRLCLRFTVALRAPAPPPLISGSRKDGVRRGGASRWRPTPTCPRPPPLQPPGPLPRAAAPGPYPHPPPPLPLPRAAGSTHLHTDLRGRGSLRLLGLAEARSPLARRPGSSGSWFRAGDGSGRRTDRTAGRAGGRARGLLPTSAPGRSRERRVTRARPPPRPFTPIPEGPGSRGAGRGRVAKGKSQRERERGGFPTAGALPGASPFRSQHPSEMPRVACVVTGRVPNFPKSAQPEPHSPLSRPALSEFRAGVVVPARKLPCRL